MRLNTGKLYGLVASAVLLTFVFCPSAMPAWAADHVVTIQAAPESVDIDLARTALVIVDMQNAFASKGGMYDLLGQDISKAKPVIQNIKKLTDAARAAGVKVIYVSWGYSPDMSDSGGPGSPNWHKNGALVAMQKNPQYMGKFLIKGSWDAAVVDDLKPQPGDILVDKVRYSGFHGTPLDIILKTYNIKYLLFTGIATNICVESTLRDGFLLDYWPILVVDSTNNAGPSSTMDGTVWTIERAFGWVAKTEDVVKVVSSVKTASGH